MNGDRIWIDMVGVLIFLSLITFGEPYNLGKWAEHSYGPTIAFDVERNGKKIGTHTVTFEREGKQLTVMSNTRMKVRFLFITAYKFSYASEEIWKSGQLVQLTNSVNDGGEKSSSTYQPDNAPGLYPTNHWNPAVLTQTVLFNTITGNENKVTISKGDLELVETGTGPREATRYTYSGDLTDVSSWYDNKERWVALQFKGRDGSTIRYVCRECGS